MIAMFMPSRQLAGDAAMAKAFLLRGDTPPPTNPTKTTDPTDGEAPQINFATARLFLERAQKSNRTLDVVIRQIGWFHERLVVLLHALLDGLESFVIRKGFLDLGVGIIPRLEFLAHLCLAF